MPFQRINSVRGSHRSDDFRRLLISAALLATVGSFAFALSVNAQDAADAGSIVYSREVNHRSAIDPGAPGRASRVDTSPSEITISAIDMGLRPISDSEAAGVIAPLGSLGTTMVRPLDARLDTLRTGGAHGNLVTQNSDGGSASGGVIANALSTVPTAMGAMRDALGASK